ncbi:MAG: tetratricopeptide repeat protein [Campylobacterales bacterium]|nr:tetratricopeptide repeat protein [Campylobacterales bacterium]
MIRWLLLLHFIWLPLNALELSIQSGREAYQNYSVLHLRDSLPFRCLSYRNDFDEIIRIECNSTKIRELPPIVNNQFTITQTATSIIIKPKTKIALFPVGFDLRYDSEIYSSDVQKVNHWTVIGYTKDLPMIPTVKANPDAINIPIKLAKESYPFVGGLDLKGNPIKMKSVQDVNDYMELKKAYKAKDYTKVLFLSQDSLKKHPATIFANELMLYQLRALHYLGQYEPLLTLSKQFVRQYSSDQNIAEVLAYTAHAHGELGQSNDSDYFYDRLLTEHEEDPFAAQGMYFKAKQLEVQGSAKKAAKYYREALSRTKDVNLASACAFELARIEMGGENLEKAKEYIDKITRVNPEYFTEVRPEAKKMIDVLEGHKDPLTAAKITQCLIKGVTHKSTEHEELLKNLGDLYAQGNKKAQALETFNEYIKLFPYGEKIAEVRRAKDGLFFEKDELSADKEMKKYEDLIERYGNDSIGQKALYKKAQLLFKEGKFEAILEMENELYKLDTTAYPESNTLITKSAIESTKKKLQDGKCSEALSMQKMYRIKLLPQWDGLTFECALKMGNFPVAKSLAQSHSKSKNIQERQVWLNRLVKTHFALGEYSEASRAGKDLIALLEIQKNTPINDIYRTMFDSAQRSSDDVGMVKTIKGCEDAFGTDFNDIERYSQMVSLGLKRKDEVMVQSYANKVMALQKRTATNTQSPFIEFTLAQSLMNQEKNKEALVVLKGLNALKMNSEKTSRQKYLIGSLAMKIGNKTEAKAAFNSSIKADKTSAWGKLAKDALGLL